MRDGGRCELSFLNPFGRCDTTSGVDANPSVRTSRGSTRPGPRLAVPPVILALVALAGACEQEPERHVDPRLVEALGLQGDELVHTISLGGRGSEEHVVPPRLEVGVGDVVQFVTVDRRVHSIRFPVDSLDRQEAAFLERTGQAGSPPLLGLGSRFVVTFKNAPPGRYLFLSSGHGEATGGIIVVR